jgi:hypothetical protein
MKRCLKPNNFPKFERPAKIDLSVKGYVDFFAIFCYCIFTRQLIVKKMPINNARNSKKKFRRSIFAGLSNLGKLFSFKDDFSGKGHLAGNLRILNLAIKLLPQRSHAGGLILPF